ncbi:hydroxysqualene dehydroxylase HpnE [Quisquiliibacterium transsilvanicum]|uniref:Squalene-associated FAD-dependent desaturase n=1 Tax=Quisquiliibacterium transsilvanicum TaxID=1549638 RepID=A0A7W8M7U3_9BURK|nr:hydroxysqualene dehydroxylase HpnE [Quisquiliibacterium transsilvanicum]MBB5270550.1 squalene-associated FAD-dependent desaturase [Quisquiliibacterium transsilvanicum]
MRVGIVGAGWAGLAAALTLAERGVEVSLYDAAPAAGGRARSVPLDTRLGRFTVDNGQHLIVGAYRESLALAASLGSDRLLRRVPLALSSPSGLSLRAARLPAPLHLGWALLCARGLGAGGRVAAVRLMAGLRQADWRTRPGETVAGLLDRFRQPPGLAGRLWAPLCIGALNTLPDAACAAAFAAVLRDTLGGARQDSDFVIADAPLGRLLPEPALERLAAQGATISLRTPVRRLVRDAGGWRIGGERFSRLLLALPPWSAAALLEASGLPAGRLIEFEPEPIATAWALWRAEAAPQLPGWSLLDEDASSGHHGQWLFDRGVVQAEDAAQRGDGRARLAGIVISAASRLDRLPSATLAEGLAAQLRAAFGGPPPDDIRVVTERRATFRCTPQRPRLDPGCLQHAAPGLWLAGDWLWDDYPATLEAAVRSGIETARRIAGSAGPAR